MKIFKELTKNELLILGCVLFLCTGNTKAQDASGAWEGKLKVQGTELRLVFNLSETDGVYGGTMDSPDQNAFGIPLSEVLVSNDSISLALKAAGISYKGKFQGDSCEGTFKQGPFTAELPLKKSTSEVVKLKRPQEPQPPFDYRIEEVQFINEILKIKLVGTLTMPKEDGPFPVVVMISGSGAQNRDEEIFGHKPFKVIADDFAKKGIAVLRFDDRGTAKSEGNHATATSADFATDVSAAVDYLKGRKEINSEQIGLVGHSEGGIIAPMVHKMRNDISFMVLMAGTGVRGDVLLLEQQRLIGQTSGMNESQLAEAAKVNKALFEILVNSEGSPEENTKKMREILEGTVKGNPELSALSQDDQEAFITQNIQSLNSPWMTYFLKYDPSEMLKRTSCSVLAINGIKDLQVPSEMNLKAIEKALNQAGNTNYTIQAIDGLNHLFQECETGAPNEYGKIEQTISPEVLDLMSAWILKTVTK